MSNLLNTINITMNGGKGSGNFGHKGRPGLRGGAGDGKGTRVGEKGGKKAAKKSDKSTTAKRLERADKLAEMRQKVRDLERDAFSGNAEGAELEAAYKKANEARKELGATESEHYKAVKEEIERGQAKKRSQDTPGKKESMELEKKALSEKQATKEAFDKYNAAREADYPWGDKSKKVSKEELAKLKADYDKVATKAAESKKQLSKSLANQMINDKQFQADLKEHLEKGLGIKLPGDIKFTVDQVSRVGSDQNGLYNVSAKVDLSKSDLGIFGNILSSASLDFSGRFSMGDTNAAVYGDAHLRYENRGGGGNGQSAFSYGYNTDGTYEIRDERGR